MNTTRLFHTVFLACLLLLCACGKDTPVTMVPPAPTPAPIPVTPPAPPPAADSSRSFLALGDSYTIGQGITPADRFAAQTLVQLKGSNIIFKEVTYLATTGWTTNNLLAAIAGTTLQPPYDIVTVLIGVNDQFQARDTTNYRDRFTQVLIQAQALAGNRNSRVFVLSIPDYSVTPFVPAAIKAQVSKEIDDFNRINKAVTLSRNIAYTDITPGSRDAATNKTLLAGDSLHFSGIEYAKWASQLAPQIKAVLQ